MKFKTARIHFLIDTYAICQFRRRLCFNSLMWIHADLQNRSISPLSPLGHSLFLPCSSLVSIGFVKSCFLHWLKRDSWEIINNIINIRHYNNYSTVLQLIVYGVRIGTTQLCSKALIHIEGSKRSKYNQAQFINYAMLCPATRICFTNHVQNHNTLQRLKVIFVKLTTAVAIEEKVNLQLKHATLVINYRRSFMSVRWTVFVFVSF